MGTEDAALAISIISIVLAVLALLWNILNVTLLDRARLDVRIDFGMKMVGGPGPDRMVVALTVINVGKRPVRLTGLWLALGKPPTKWRRLVPSRWRHLGLPNLAIMNPGYDSKLVALQTEIPLMLGVGEAAYIYDYDQAMVLEGAKKQGATHAYAKAYGSTADGTSRAKPIPYET